MCCPTKILRAINSPMTARRSLLRRSVGQSGPRFSACRAAGSRVEAAAVAFVSAAGAADKVAIGGSEVEAVMNEKAACRSLQHPLTS